MRNHSKIPSNMVSLLAALSLLLTGGVWGVLCESPNHTAVESVNRDCCSKSLCDEALQRCAAEQEGCSVCAHHSSCRDTPLVVSVDRPGKKSDEAICMCAKCRLLVSLIDFVSSGDFANDIAYMITAPEPVTPQALSTVLLI